MTYKGWIDTIYELYIEEKYYYKEKKSLVRLIHSLNKNMKIKLIICFMGYIFGMGFYVYGLFYNRKTIFFFGIIDIVLVMLYSKKVTKFTINDYKYNINILRNILKKESIYSIAVIDKLIKDTSSIFYRLLNGDLSNLIKIITGILSSVILKVFIENTSIELLISIFNFLLATIIIIMLFFGIYSIYPYNRKTKMKELNEMLKILLIYELGKK